MPNDIESVVAAIAAADPERGRLARAVADWLTGGEGLELIDQASIQNFAWYALPLKWMTNLDGHLLAAEVAAELLSRLGLDRYSAILASEDTARILAAYDRSENEGFAAFRKAAAASGVEAVDLADFVWGDIMGWQESAARTAVERALEAAIVAGELRPGASGWKKVAARVTERTLDAEIADPAGQTPRMLVVTERLGSWVDGARSRSPRLFELRSRHANRLLHPVTVPTDVDERMAPVWWLLERTAGTVTLTQAGYLDTATVRDGCERFGWDLFWTDRAAKSESEVVELFELHHLLRRLGVLRRQGKRLLPTRRGTAWLGDHGLAWREMAAGLSTQGWARAVAEVTTLLYLDGVRLDLEIHKAVAAVLAEYGWSSDGEAPDNYAAMSGWHEVGRPLRMLSSTEEVGLREERHTVLAPFAVDTLLELIRADATGPRSRPW